MKGLLDPSALDALARRIQALRAKTVENGCTQAEALLAVAKVAELLDRHDLTLGDAALREALCERRAYRTQGRKRIPLDVCVGAVAAFCDCRVWREKQPDGEIAFVFFGLSADAEAAHCLAGVIDAAIRTELGRYKTSAEYQRVRHQDRHMANASFALGMAASIADRLTAAKAARERGRGGDSRGLVVMKSARVEAEMRKLDLALRTVRRPARVVSPPAYDAGGAAAARVDIGPDGDTS
ncbi:MAG: hypothetical protein JWN93_2140 [Hyphomicrobiales bacterium]|nr:hypothetical protein [Hyphomicrobiales bacterium]